MSMKQQLTEDMKAAMKAGEKHKLGVIRLINAAIKQREVDERIELDDTAVIAVLDKMVKQRKDSVSQYEAANREDQPHTTHHGRTSDMKPLMYFAEQNKEAHLWHLTLLHVQTSRAATDNGCTLPEQTLPCLVEGLLALRKHRTVVRYLGVERSVQGNLGAVRQFSNICLHIRDTHVMWSLTCKTS